MQSVRHVPVSRCIGPKEGDTRRKNGKRSIWGVRGWLAVGEEGWLEWLEAINKKTRCRRIG